jgi:hypothetical protein
MEIRFKEVKLMWIGNQMVHTKSKEINLLLKEIIDKNNLFSLLPVFKTKKDAFKAGYNEESLIECYRVEVTK